MPNWKDILKKIVDFGKTTIEDYVESEVDGFKAIGETGVRFAKITTQSLAQLAAGTLPKSEFDEIRASLWNATKSELISKGYDSVAKQGEVAQNTITFVAGIVGAILGGLK